MAYEQSKEGKLRQEVYESGLETAQARLRSLQVEKTQMEKNISTSQGRLRVIEAQEKTVNKEIADIQKLLETDTK